MQEVYIFSTMIVPVPVFLILNSCFTLPVAIEIGPKSKAFSSAVSAPPPGAGDTDAVFASSKPGLAIQTTQARTNPPIDTHIFILLSWVEKLNPLGGTLIDAQSARSTKQNA